MTKNGITGTHTNKNKMVQNNSTPQIQTHKIVEIETTDNKQGYTTPQEKYKA